MTARHALGFYLILAGIIGTTMSIVAAFFGHAPPVGAILASVLVLGSGYVLMK